MTKYKKLLITLSCVFGFIIFAIILSFTLLSVRNVKLNFKNETNIYTEGDAQDYVIKTAEIPYGMPIFSVNKKEIINKIEKQNPYIQVINIETVFPNNLIIHVAQREDMFAVKISDNLYYICDSNLKVLKPEVTSNYVSEQTNAIILNGVIVDNKTVKVGEFLELEYGNEIVKNLANAFAFNNKTISDTKGMVKSINIDIKANYYTKTPEIIIEILTFDNFCVEIDLPKFNLVEKLNLMLALVPLSADKYQTHKLIIRLNPENTLDNFIRYEKIQ